MLSTENYLLLKHREKNLQSTLSIGNVSTLKFAKINRCEIKEIFDNYNTNELNVSNVQSLRKPKKISNLNLPKFSKKRGHYSLNKFL